MSDKLFTIVAGVNGVGKSTYIARLCENPNTLGYIIDPDQLSIKYGNIIAGGRKALQEIDNCIRNGISFTEETTLSGKHIADTIIKAKANGYTVNMVYIALNSAEESIARVAERVRKGGHISDLFYKALTELDYMEYKENDLFNRIDFAVLDRTKAEKIKVVDSLSVKTAEITNIVYYYPLIDGVGNFLKRPIVKIADIADSTRIIERGVREFLDNYKDIEYIGNLKAKLGIYCGSIEKLEEVVYPLVSQIVAEYGLPTNVILKFHKGNKQYPAPTDSQMQFDILDKAISEKRIILLVQIGKEGWDCRSLTGIILSQEGDCPTNMVLQTSCRCLRQVIKGHQETALIYLNESNAEKLNMQLEQQQHITLKEFSSADNNKTPLKRYDRTTYLKLPKIDFYQLKINYNTLTIEKSNPAKSISSSADAARIADGIIKTTDLSMDESKTTRSVDNTEYGNVPASFKNNDSEYCREEE